LYEQSIRLVVRFEAMLVDGFKSHTIMLYRQVSWLANDWLSNVRSPAGHHPDQEAQRQDQNDYHELIRLSAKRTDGIKYRNVC
jgi:hypothetical protein